MKRSNPLNSVVTRMVTALLLAGFLVSVCMGAFEYHRSGEVLRQERIQEIQVVSRDVQGISQGLLNSDSEDKIPHSLSVVTAGTSIIGTDLIRLDDGSVLARIGEVGFVDEMPIIELQEVMSPSGNLNLSLEEITRVRQVFQFADGRYQLDLIVGAEGVRAAMLSMVLRRIGSVWVFMAVVMLGGLVLLRRWLTSPLTKLVELTNGRTGAEGFEQLAQANHNEFGVLSQSIAEMLRHLQATRGDLERSEHAFKELYQSAPAAMLNLEPEGTIVGLNRRMASLLNGHDEASLVGQHAEMIVEPNDRPCLQQALRNLLSQDITRCELRLACAQDADACDVSVEAVAVRDEAGTLTSIRMSLTDITETARLHRDVARQTQMLHMVIDHMSDAILLVDPSGNIAAFNQQFTNLVKTNENNLQNQPYDAQLLWQSLDIIDSENFIKKLDQIEADTRRSAQETFETRDGAVLFVGVPVNDVHGQYVGRLWVVKEADPDHRNTGQLLQQDHELRVIRQFTHAMQGLDTIDELMKVASEQLFELLDVEAVGLAIRRTKNENDRRSLQILNRGKNPYLWQSNQALVQQVEADLMPNVMAQGDVTLWAELPMNKAWAVAAEQAGISSLAASPLMGPREAQGIVWIARRGGERVDRHHLFLLETMAPFIAAKLEMAQLHEGLQENGLLDPTTGLANSAHMQHRLSAVSSQSDEPWSLLHIRVSRSHEDQHSGARWSNAELRDFGQSLLALSRRSVFIAHLGQGEFVLIASSIQPQESEAFARRVLQQLFSHDVDDEGRDASVPALSIGVAHSHESTDAKTVCAAAKARVEIAVQQGPDQLVTHESSLADRLAS